MMKIKIWVMFSLILSLALISGCTYGSYSTTKSVEISTFSKMSMSYEKFNGYKTSVFNIEEGEEFEVDVSIVSEEGNLGLTVVRETETKGDKKLKSEESENIYQGNELPTSDFKVTLDKPGKYKITVTGENHKGKFNITWDQVNKK